MRLLHTTTLRLQEFFGSDIPPYYILSHRWEADEITYQDVRDGTNTQAYGWSKVRNACTFAHVGDRNRRDELQRQGVKEPEEVVYVWIDTCCIDKTSSAELTEAVNSMFSWYQRAEECLVYLKDVPSGLSPDARNESILQSEWFKRGWTLQELLAPKKLVFISSDWREIFGSRYKFSKVILSATGIQQDDFKALRRNKVSVAVRMSWASRRICTREEDEAYCLMGLFGVNMPLLYGEGRKAFQRLQAEILKDSDDESIFAWWTERSALQNQSGTGLLATSPHDFKHSQEVYPVPFDLDAKPYSMTNKGLQTERVLIDLAEWAEKERYFLALDRSLRSIQFTKWQQKHLCAIALNCHLRTPAAKLGIIAETSTTPILLILRRIVGSSNSYCRLFVSYTEMRPSPRLASRFEGSQDKQTIFLRPPIANTQWPSIESLPREVEHQDDAEYLSHKTVRNELPENVEELHRKDDSHPAVRDELLEDAESLCNEAWSDDPQPSTSPFVSKFKHLASKFTTKQ